MHDKIAPSAWVLELANHNSELLDVIYDVLESLNSKEITSYASINDALLTKIEALRDIGDTKTASALLDVRNKFINPPPIAAKPISVETQPTNSNLIGRRATLALIAGAGIASVYRSLQEPEDSPYLQAIHRSADNIENILIDKKSNKKYPPAEVSQRLNTAFAAMRKKRLDDLTIKEAQKYEMGVLTTVLKRAVWDGDGLIVSMIAANYPAYIEEEIYNNYNLMEDVRKHYGETVAPDPNFSKDKLLGILKNSKELAKFTTPSFGAQR